MTDYRVLEEIISIKVDALKLKDHTFQKVLTEVGNELGQMEVMMEEESFFPAQILRKIRELKQLIKVAA